MKLIDYKLYCESVLLNEETLDELLSRVRDAFPDPNDFKAHKAILDKFPSFGGKQIVAGLLIRTRAEREIAGISPEATLELLEEFKLIQMAMTGPGQKIDLALLAKQDKIEHPDDKDSKLFEKLTMIVHEKMALLKDRALKRAQKKSVQLGGEEEGGENRPQYPNADLVHMDENVEVYLTLSPGIIAQMVEDPGGVCTQRPGNYYGYRFTSQSTLYMVIPRKDELKLKYKFLQFDIRPDGTLIVVDQRNQQGAGTMNAPSRNSAEALNINLGKTLTKSNWWTGFPELKEAISKGVFKVVPLQPKEEEIHNVIKLNVNDETFKAFDYVTKTAYIGYGWLLTDKQWNMIDNEQRNAYINTSRTRDITPYQFEQVKLNNQLFKRYLALKKDAVINKIKSGKFTSDTFTPHESIVLGDIMKTSDPKVKSAITTGLVDTIRKLLLSGEVPKMDISSMYELVKTEFLNNPNVRDGIFLSTIAKLLAGGKTSQWKGTAPEILRSIYKIAKDIYDANPQMMDVAINDMIKKDPNVLLQGLLSEPTHFQAQYFEKNKKSLLSNGDFSDKLDTSIESNLIYGTDMNPWLKSYWNNTKKEYLGNPEFVKKLKYDLTNVLYGKPSTNFTYNIEDVSDESKEIYNLFIKAIRSDINTIKEIVSTTAYDIMIGGGNVDEVEKWKTSKDFKKFFLEHEDDIKTWLSYKMIDTPPDNMRPDMAKLIHEYSEKAFSNPEYQKKIEDRLIRDIVMEESVFRWSGARIDYWMKNFWQIIEKNPGLEEKLVKKVIYEYGKDNMANGIYLEWCIPLEFYKKHENEIIRNPDAFRGIKNRVIETMRWRNPKELTIEQVLNSPASSPVERDFYLTHKNVIETDEDSKWAGKPIFNDDRLSPARQGEDY